MTWNEFVAVTSIVSTTVVTIATIVLARLTSRYVRLTADLLEHSRTSLKPSVFIDLEFHRQTVYFVIENRGGGTAHNVSFSVEKDVPWLKWPSAEPGGVSGLPCVRCGVSYLTPGRRLEFLVGVFHQLPQQGENTEIRLRVEFSDDAGLRFGKDVVIDMAQYVGVSAGSFLDGGAKIAQAIKDQTFNQSARTWLR